MGLRQDFSQNVSTIPAGADPVEYQQQRQQAISNSIPTTTMEKVKAAYDLGDITDSSSYIYDSVKKQLAGDSGKKIPKADLNRDFGDKVDVGFSQDMTLEQAQIIMDRQRKIREYQHIISKGGTTNVQDVLNFASGMAGGLSVADAAVGIGVGAAVALAAPVGIASASLAWMTANPIKGAFLKSLAGNAISEVPTVMGAQDLQESYTIADSFKNVTGGALLEAGLPIAFKKIFKFKNTQTPALPGKINEDVGFQTAVQSAQSGIKMPDLKDIPNISTIRDLPPEFEIRRIEGQQRIPGVILESKFPDGSSINVDNNLSVHGSPQFINNFKNNDFNINEGFITDENIPLKNENIKLLNLTEIPENISSPEFKQKVLDEGYKGVILPKENFQGSKNDVKIYYNPHEDLSLKYADDSDFFDKFPPNSTPDEFIPHTTEELVSQNAKQMAEDLQTGKASLDFNEQDFMKLQSPEAQLQEKKVTDIDTDLTEMEKYFKALEGPENPHMKKFIEDLKEIKQKHSKSEAMFKDASACLGIF